MKLLAGLLVASVASAPAERPCLTTGEAETLTLVALPEVIRQTGAACAAQLPAASLLRQRSSAMIGRYDAEADRAWPAARAAIVKLSNPTASALLQSDYARPLLATIVAPLIVGRINPRDCGTIDRLVASLAPLPPRNTAAAIVAAVQYAQRATPDSRNPAASLPLCRAEAR